MFMPLPLPVIISALLDLMPLAAFYTPLRKLPNTPCKLFKALGGNGYINDYPAARLLRDAKLYEIGAGTSEIRRMLIGRELFDATRP